MRDGKGSEYDGGHRVPFFIHWPAGQLTGGRDVDQLTAHIDVLPTLAELCGVERPAGPELDGMSLAAALRGDPTGLPDRTLLVHSQRLETPEKWRKSSVMTHRWRLINGRELYDIQADPGQRKNIAAEHPEVVGRLTAAYQRWWESLQPEFDEFVRIGLGWPAEPRTRLHSHDWHVESQSQSPWHQNHVRSGLLANGFWAVDVMRPGRYRVELCRWPDHLEQPIDARHARLRIGSVAVEQEVDPRATKAVFEVDLPAGPGRLQSWLTTPQGEQRGAYYVYVERLK